MNRVCFIAFLLVFSAVPFELPIEEVLHGVFRPNVGEIYLLFSCGTLLILASLLCLFFCARRLRVGSREFSVYAGLFVALGLVALFVTSFANTGELQLCLQQLAFGYIAPALCCFALLLMTEREQRSAWLAFYGGWCLFLSFSLLFLILSWQTAVNESSFFAELTLGQKLFAWRYMFGQPWNLYSLYIGNANKESNYILLFLLFSSFLLGSKEIEQNRTCRRVYFAFWLLSVFTLLVLFSRAALLFLPLVIRVSGFWGRLQKRTKWTIAAALCATLVFGFSSYSAALAYLFTAAYVGDSTGDVLGSLTDRFVQWGELKSFLVNHKGALIFGLGTGGYGLHFFNSAERGTHNMFLDILTESGITGLAILVLLVVLLGLDCLGYFWHRRVHVVGATALMILIGLMFREHSVSYLYVTSLGGLCFTALFYVVASGNHMNASRDLCRYSLPDDFPRQKS